MVTPHLRNVNPKQKILAPKRILKFKRAENINVIFMGFKFNVKIGQNDNL